MAAKNTNTSLLDTILKKMIVTVDQSKGELFAIAEQSRRDYESLLGELEQVRIQVHDLIDEQDELETKVRMARNRLSEVSQNFHTYSEETVRQAYEKAHNLQMQLLVSRQKEKQFLEKRNDLERRLSTIESTIERAEHLVSQVSVVLNYLTQDMKQIGEVLEDARLKQEFGLQIMEAQEEERKRLSREIHDGPAQMMANVLLRSDLIERLYRERGVDEAFKEIRSLKQMVRSALYEVRRIIYDLRPMALDDLGLVPTLKKYLATVEEHVQSLKKTTKIHFTNMGSERRLPSKLEVALFRLIQESVQNALKHSEATSITVKLEIKAHQALAVIKDNGRGFDIREKKSSSFGIMGMKERLELLEGDLSIHSKPNDGTLVMIRVPIVD
ncbi:sensor histidine kinase [Bacillus badius]|uniref:Signal transduction histidine-protein kinase/phosphatase DegS n=1 Tax=Bacillus badius TaxID=1455 RepID=A0ABR5AUR9_BACBA|nr:histidine kinase [Bacillus badius]KIL76364.1 Sensor protein DegS [Bacillus badius]KIL78482.1 Sensor protein DegS [Bacillus badius]KZO00114.1 histidine kinase [Bacillus badius]KZR59832.1 histidine kinase [Bacillus badius]MED4717458.1 histidine kinase [Bacillus badius]